MHRAVFGLILLLAGCDGDSPSSPPPSPPPPASSGGWFFQYSPGMTIPNAFGAGGFSFLFPVTDGVHYLLRAHNAPLTSGITITYSIDAPAGVVFVPHGDTCPSPDGGRLGIYFHRSNDALMQNEWGRWWYAERTLLAGGAFTVTAPFSDLTKWTQAYGKSAASNPDAWVQAIASVAEVGVTFGGKCSAGHGVSVAGGIAAIAATSFTAQ